MSRPFPDDAVLTGGDDDGGGPQASGSPTGGQQGASAQTRGQAIIARQTSRPQIVVTATGLPPSTERSAYQVWLYNSTEDRRSVGAQVTDARGTCRPVVRCRATTSGTASST